MVDINKIESVIGKHILGNQTKLVNHLLNIEVFFYDDIINNYNEDDEESTIDIFEWYLIDDCLLHFLNKNNIPLLKNNYGNWWGRTSYGQSLFIDDIIIKFYNIRNK